MTTAYEEADYRRELEKLEILYSLVCLFMPFLFFF